MNAQTISFSRTGQSLQSIHTTQKSKGNLNLKISAAGYNVEAFKPKTKAELLI